MQGLDHFWQEPWTQNTWMSTLSQNPAAQGLQPAAWMYTGECIIDLVDSSCAGNSLSVCLSLFWEVTGMRSPIRGPGGAFRPLLSKA